MHTCTRTSVWTVRPEECIIHTKEPFYIMYCMGWYWPRLWTPTTPSGANSDSYTIEAYTAVCTCVTTPTTTWIPCPRNIISAQHVTKISKPSFLVYPPHTNARGVGEHGLRLETFCTTLSLSSIIGYTRRVQVIIYVVVQKFALTLQKLVKKK